MIIHLTPILKTNETIYYIFMKLFPLIIYILAILIIYSSYSIHKNKKKKIMLVVSILRVCLPIICIGFYGQIFLFLLTLFDCKNGKSYIKPEMDCKTGINYLAHLPFVSLAIVLHIIISFITNNLYYRTLFLPSKSDVLKKTNSLPDVILYLTKTIIIIFFIIDKETESEHWVYIFLLMIITGFNAYINISAKNRLNIKLMLLNIILSLILFFGFFTLFINKLLIFLGYNGGFYFFIFWVLYLFLFIIFYKRNQMEFILTDFKYINNANDYIKYILQYYRMIVNKENSRNNLTLLKSYLETIEETCINIECPLKIYLEQLKKGYEYKYLLYQYIDILFRYGISKFKNNVVLKSIYAMFLASKMNNKKQAKNILNSIKDEFLSFNRGYNLYRCKKMINNNYFSSNNNYYFNYKTNINDFKKLILELTQLYFEFWNLLNDSKLKNKDNFKDIFTNGSKIMKLRKKVEDKYQMLMKNKTDNIEIFKLYSEYIKDILKDEEKLEKMQNNSIFSQSIKNEDKDYLNYNIDIFKKDDLTNYLLISGTKKDLGIIIDCSINTSKLFGYTKDEIIGRNINIFIPDLFHSKHNNIISKQSKTNNFNLFNHLFNKKEYNLDIKITKVFGVYKSKFIKPIKCKIYFVKTEDNKVAFFVNILKDTPYEKELINKISNDSNIDNRCCILTNDNFLINTFTPNCLQQLGLSYRYIKSNNSIIPFIKQLHFDYLNSINELNSNLINVNSHLNTQYDIESLDDSSKLSDIKINTKNKISPEMKKKIKNDLINKKYNKICQITWRQKIHTNKYKSTNEIGNYMGAKCSRISYRGSNYSFSTNIKIDEKELEIEFLMEVKKAMMDNTLLGYYFYFSRLYLPETKNFISYQISADLNNNGENKKIVKYKTIIRPMQKIKSVYKERKRISASEIGKNKISINNSSTKSEEFNSFISKRIKIKENLQNNTTIVHGFPVDFLGLEPKIQQKSIFSSAQNNNDVDKDEIIIDENYVPKCFNSFSFDLPNMCYNFEKNTSKLKLLNKNLHKEAMEKIKIYQEYLNSLKKDKTSDRSESDSEEEYSSNSSEEVLDSSNTNKESSSISKVKPHEKKLSIINKKNILKAISLTNEVKSKIEKISPIKESNSLKVIKEAKEEKEIDLLKESSQIILDNYNNNNDNNVSRQIKKVPGKNHINFFRVSLNKIHYLIYDFNKDMFVEGNKNDISIKIENILNNIKKQNDIINIGKDENYPCVSINNSKDVKKNLNKKIEKNKKIEDINQNNEKNEEKKLSIKINKAINNKHEKEIYSFKIFMTISFFIMLILAIIIFILYLNLFHRLAKILELLKNIVNISYCLDFSLYFVRELTLVNFNVSNIDGGIYTNYPAHDLETYKILLKNKLVSYFIENQKNLIYILSTNYSYSKSLNDFMSKTYIYTSVFKIKNHGIIKGNILSTLIHYNSVLYGISSFDNNLYQNHSDMLPFIFNGFNNFKNTIVLLRDKFIDELYIQKSDITFYIIINNSIILIIFGIMTYFMVMSYISAAKRRLFYIEIFYGISPITIRDISSNCEKLMNKLKKNEHKNTEGEDLEQYSEEEKSNLKKNNINETSSTNKPIKSSIDKKKKLQLSFSGKLFFIFYIIAIIGMYLYFPYNSFVLNKICKKALKRSSFFMKMNHFQTNIIQIFNAFREYIFDNGTIIEGLNPFNYIIKKDLEIYQSIISDINFVTSFLANDIIWDEELIILFNKDICDYYITDYFNSTEQCRAHFGNILNYDYSIFILNFLQRLRYTKNIIKYKMETEEIIGNLSRYDIEKWSKWNNSYFGEEYNYNGNKKILFRLDLFNNETLHSEMNLLFINVFLPYKDENRKILLKKINIDGEKKYFLIYFIIYIILLLVIHIFLLFPMTNYIEEFIYNTKNMLLLIPISILTVQNNIKSLFNL